MPLPTDDQGPGTPFCEKTERGGLKCEPCFDSVCTVSSKREQRTYQGFGIHDTILVHPNKRNPALYEIETDIEVPFAVDPKKGSAGVRDKMVKNKTIVTMAMGPMPEGIRGPWFHQHYAPNRLPDIASLHVHIAATAKSPLEAKQLSEKMWKIVNADRLTKLVGE